MSCGKSKVMIRSLTLRNSGSTALHASARFALTNYIDNNWPYVSLSGITLLPEKNEVPSTEILPEPEPCLACAGRHHVRRCDQGDWAAEATPGVQ